VKDSGFFDFWRRFGAVTGLFKSARSPNPRQKIKNLRGPPRHHFYQRSKSKKPSETRGLL